MIAIVDYGAGNPISVKKAFDWLGRDCTITSDPDVIRRAAAVVLPGVGHFSATQPLAESGIRQAIVESVGRGGPFLGICVGMQWMYQGSEESPQTPGSGMLPGMCIKFSNVMKLPHVGWNDLKIATTSRLFRDVPQLSLVYFTHSYYIPIGEATIASCEYGSSFSAAVERDHIFGVQFHPEKSGDVGLKLLSNFCEM